MSRAEASEWFITLSKPERGGMTEEDDKVFLEKIKKYRNYNHIIVVKELYNKYQQLFHHYHILVWNKRIRRQDKVRETFCKYHPDISKNPKDVNVKHMKCASTLLKNYLTKQSDCEYIYEDIDEEFKQELLDRCKSDEKKQYPLKGMKVPSLTEAPYVIERHIRDKGIEVKHPIDLNYVMKDMIASREYVLVHLYRKRLDIWRTLSVLLEINSQEATWSSYLDDD